MARLRKKGIFYLLDDEEARRLAATLALKLIEKKVTEPDGTTKIRMSCGFPQSGLDKYVGKLLRMGEDVEIIENGAAVEKIRVAKDGSV
ncbi:MAG: hypothetical protein QME32_07290 [Endomicrobiia bacterium]|nr:hypothetical protein [Endomicrobiia bacterium]